MGGSFGGMPYQAPGSAIVGGIEAGQNYILRAQEADQRRDQIQHENDRQDRLDAMNAAHQQFMERNETDANNRANFKEAWGVHDEERKDLQGNMQALLEQHGGDASAAQADPAFSAPGGYGEQIQNWNKAHRGLMENVYGKVLNQGVERAKEWTDGMASQNPDMNPADPANKQNLHHAVSVMFKTDPQQCLQPSYGGKSPAETAQANLTQALASGDKQAIGQGLDQVFGNQFQAGRLGYLDPLGGQITDASLHPSTPFVPTPTGSAAMPVISTTGQYPDGSLTSQPCAAPTTGGFDHPDNDDLHAIAPSKVMDHLGNLGVAQAGLNHPAIQANLRSAAQNPDQENLDWAHAYTALGLSKPTMGGDLKEVTNANGSKDWVYLPRTASGYGTPVQVTHSGQTGKPGAGRATTSAQIFEQGIQAAIQNGDLSPEEGNQLRIQQGLHLGADALPWPDEQKLTGEDAAAKVHLAKTGAHQATGGIGIRAPAVAQVPGSGTPQNAGPPIVDAPQDPNKRQQGMTYNTPKGKLIWLGGGKWGVPGGATGSQ